MIAAAVPLTELPQGLLAEAPFQSSAAWWRCVIAAGLPPGADAHLLLAHQQGRPAGLLPLCRQHDPSKPGQYKAGLSKAGLSKAGLTGLVTPYTCLFQPLAVPGADPHALGRAFGRACAAWPVLRLDALDPGWAGWPGLLAGFADSGWRAAWFDSFGNWHAAAAAGWEAYLAGRPGALRETIRRKLRRAERDPAYSFRLARQGPEVAAALAAYQAVYRCSWKPPEPYPDFAAALLAEAGGAGVLRIGVLARDGVPLAAQYWTVEAGIATVHKLAHDETARALSPGTVLTAWMVRGLLAEGVTALDFGRGDDPYKQLWADARRQRKGLILARPWRLRGAAALARQGLAEWRRRLQPTPEKPTPEKPTLEKPTLATSTLAKPPDP